MPESKRSPLLKRGDRGDFILSHSLQSEHIYDISYNMPVCTCLGGQFLFPFGELPSIYLLLQYLANKCLRTITGGIVKECVGGIFLNNLAFVHKYYTICNGSCKSHFMGDH